jgi:transcriptional regulator with XRE-family HTH domain
MHKKGDTDMGTLYENIIALCNKRGIKGGKMCTDIGMSKGILTDLKMGRQNGISATNAQKIASYFGVTVGCLLGEEDCNEGIKKEHPTDDLGEMSEKKQELIKFAMSLSEAEAQKMLQIMKTILATD